MEARKRDVEWVPLQAHPVFVHKRTLDGSVDGSSASCEARNVAAWNAFSSRLYLWDSGARCVHRLSLRFSSSSDAVVVEAALPSEKFVLDVQPGIVILQVSLNKDGSALFLLGSDVLSIMFLDERTSLTVNTVTRRTKQVGSQTYFGCKNDLKILHASWHPYSKSHLGILSSDSVFRLFNLSSDFQQPEQEYYLQVVEPGNRRNFGSVRPTAFSFGGQHLWERFSVFVMYNDGSIYVLCPIVPFGCCFISTHIVEIYKDLTSSVSKSTTSKFVTKYNTMITWLRATFPEVSEQLTEQGINFVTAEPSANPDASICLQGPVKVSYGISNESGSTFNKEGTAVGFLYSCTGKDSIFFIAWSGGQIHIDALVDEIEPLWLVDNAPRLHLDSFGCLVGIAMICEARKTGSSSANFNQPPNQLTFHGDSDDAVRSCRPSALGVAVIDLALPQDVIDKYPFSLLLDPIYSDRFYCLHGGGADLITLKFLPFSSNITSEVDKSLCPSPPSVHPILTKCFDKSFSPSICGFAVVDDSYGLSKIVAITSSYECLLLDAQDLNSAQPLHSQSDEISIGLSSVDVPEILSEEILSGPKITLVPPSSFRTLNAESVEGRSALCHYEKVLHENYVQYAHKVYVELNKHGDHLKMVIDDQQRRLSTAKLKLLNSETRSKNIDARTERALELYKLLEQRLQSFKALRAENNKPLSTAELDFKAELVRLMDYELPTLQSSVDALNARLRRSRTSTVVPSRLSGRSRMEINPSSSGQLRSSLEKLSMTNKEAIDKALLVENELKKLKR